MNVLIVEDEIIVAMDIESKLQAMGYQVVDIVDNYDDAIRMAEKHVIDLALLDINIQGTKTGIDIGHTFKDHFDIPFVFLTAFSNNTIINSVKEVGAYGYVLKPFSQKDLYSTMEIALNKFKREKMLTTQKELLEKIVEDRTKNLLDLNQQLNEKIEANIEIRYALAKSEEFHRNTIKHLGSGLIVIDGAGQIISANPAICKITSYHEDELLSKNIEELFCSFSFSKAKQTLESGPKDSIFDEIEIYTQKRFPIWVQLWMSKTSVDEEKKYILSIIDINQQKLNEALLKEERESKMLSLLEGEENERKRIAAEIHDGLGQKLSAAKFTLGALLLGGGLPENKLEMLEETKLLIEEAINEAREISQNLTPSVLNDYGLEAALKKIIGQLDGKNGLKISFTKKGNIEDVPFEIKRNLYRISQEIVNNAIKYSKAENLNISVNRHENGKYNVVISDNGIGFDITNQKRGNGLNNIMERCISIKAECEIKTTPNKGTSIAITV